MLHRFSTFIHEDHAQMELPFAGKKSAKPLHVQFLDAIEELAKQNAKSRPLYHSTAPWDKVKDKAREEGIAECWSQIDDSESIRNILSTFIESYVGVDNMRTSLFSPEFVENEHFKKGKISLDDMRDAADDLAQFGTRAFSKTGLALFKKKFPDIIDDILYEGEGGRDLFDTIEHSMDDNGLIPCWRAMVIDDVRMKNVYNKEEHVKVKDLFSEMTKVWKGVGGFWSWNEKAAQPYNGYSSSPHRIDVMLHGRTRTDDIEWPRTIWVNVWDLKEEQEVTIKGQVLIEAVEFETSDGKKMKHVIEGGLLIPTGRNGSGI